MKGMIKMGYKELEKIEYEQVLRNIDYNLTVKYESFNYSPTEKIALTLHNLHSLLELHEDWIHPIYRYVKDNFQDDELHKMLNARLNESPLESLDYFW